MEKQTTQPDPYIKPSELAGIIGKSPSTAQRLICKCNQELKKQGYFTFQGQCLREYVFERLGLTKENV